MKRFVIVSDSHGNKAGIEKLLPLVAENHYFLFLGDGLGDISPALESFPKKTYCVAGNCDFFYGIPTEGIIEAEGVKVFYCHGHKYGVKSGLQTLATTAKNKGCRVALYGHTHCACVDEMDGVLLVNPGTLRYELGKGGSYAYLVVNGEKVTATVVGDKFI